MKIFFIGSVEFSFQALDLLILNGYQVVGVGCKDNSSFNSDFRDLSSLCSKNSIPFKYMKDVNHPNNIEFITSYSPDVIYCFGWSSLIKNEVLNIAPLGVVGFHPSLLPDNRGRHPIIWALALGLKETGSSFFIMDEGADTGDLISQKVIPIDLDDDAASLYKKIVDTALPQIVNFTEDFKQNQVKRQPQRLQGNNWRKRGKADGKIDFRMTSLSIYNLVRALTQPYVGAHIETIGGNIKVWKVSIENYTPDNIEPGKILDINANRIRVKTADGSIWLESHEFKSIPLLGTYL